ncbi:histidine-type phosphatase [Streptomyces europaeiscabiei]|uniref:histidine-type phosphatase n=1 Tax=Streptomyces europaeiscabiei TaxID=146819 RepID=UPI0029A53CFF|nr:histidine-type phosphatase [Streptomyces europaeiscabiei]MDX3615532.1 histidine-type phosphatase [Streptomyces europaeiscabiei]
MRRTAPALALGLSALLVAPLSAQAAVGHASATTLSYGTKATYAPQQKARSYRSAPEGFVPVFTENVSRHGSRSATDSSDGDLILALWDKASSEGQLTARGREFGPRVRALQAAMAKVGYGNLSGRGRQEMRDTATRLEKRLPGLFRRIAQGSEKIDVVSSGQGRAVDSGNTFATALGDAAPAVKPLIGPARTDKDLLYFHKSSGGAAYQTWLANDRRLADTLESIKNQPATARAAKNVLKKIFKPAFVRRIAAGEFASTGSAVDAAEAVYNLYAIAPAMSEESPGGKGWHLDRYIARRDADWFGYLGDAEDFYEKGPSFAGSDITYGMANVLLDDFFQQVEAKRDGTSDLGAELRFTHAEEIIPLAALMGLPGSTEAATAGKPYTYADSPWRGANVAPLGANIQWDVFKRGSTYLVRMLYNEKETAFKSGCRPVSKNSPFYELNELERCFGRKA